MENQMFSNHFYLLLDMQILFIQISLQLQMLQIQKKRNKVYNYSTEINIDKAANIHKKKIPIFHLGEASIICSIHLLCIFYVRKNKY
jgi:hypothetical protein